MQLFDEDAERAFPAHEIPASVFVQSFESDGRITCDHRFSFGDLDFRLSFAQTPNDAFTLGLFLQDRQLLMLGAFLKQQIHSSVWVDLSRHIDLFLKPSR